MAGLHIIIGEDEFLVAQAARKLVAGIGDGLEVIDSISSSNEEAQLADIRAASASFFTPPFLEPVKATWWKNVGFLPQGGSNGPGERVFAALGKFAASIAAATLPDNQTFVISAPRMLKTSVFAKTLAPVAEITEFAGAKSKSGARNSVVYAIDFAEEAGFKFDHGVAERFAAIVGNDTRSIKSEIDKLRNYLGSAKVATAADVDAITSCGIGVEPVIWDVTDAIGERDVRKALAAVARFEGENGFAVLMTSVIERFFRQLVELKDAAMRGMSERATASMNPYAARKNLRYAGNWTLRELRIARSRFVTLREKAVSSTCSVDILIITELVRTLNGESRKEKAK